MQYYGDIITIVEQIEHVEIRQSLLFMTIPMEHDTNKKAHEPKHSTLFFMHLSKKYIYVTINIKKLYSQKLYLAKNVQMILLILKSFVQVW